MRHDTSGDGCIVLIIIGFCAFISFVAYHNHKFLTEKNRLSKETVYVSSEDFQNSLNFNGVIKNVELKDFTIDDTITLTDNNEVPFLIENCIFTNVTFELERLHKIDFKNCKFINVKFKGILIENTLFLQCIFEASEFNNCIIGKGVKYYDWTVSTLNLVDITYAPEHVGSDGISKFKTFVESSME